MNVRILGDAAAGRAVTSSTVTPEQSVSGPRSVLEPQSTSDHLQLSGMVDMLGDQLKAAAEAMRTKEKQQELERRSHGAETERWRSELQVVCQNRDDAVKERDTFRKERDDAQQERDIARREQDETKTELVSIREERDKFRDSLEKVRKSAVQLRAEDEERRTRELGELRRDLRTVQDERARYRDEVLRGNERLQVEVTKSNNLRAQIEEEKQRADHAADEIRRLKQELSAAKSEIDWLRLDISGTAASKLSASLGGPTKLAST